MKLVITVDIPNKWVPAFIGTLERMEYLGRTGKSEKIVFYADGRSDFKPKFQVLNDGWIPRGQKPAVNSSNNSSHFYIR